MRANQGNKMSISEPGVLIQTSVANVVKLKEPWEDKTEHGAEVERQKFLKRVDKPPKSKRK